MENIRNFIFSEFSDGSTYRGEGIHILRSGKPFNLDKLFVGIGTPGAYYKFSANLPETSPRSP